jgi:plasmid stabilization system protein ParE
VKYKVERIEAADRDLDLIFDFLVESHLEFGASIGRAWETAADRMRRVHGALEALGDLPHQGTLRNELLPGMRSTTKERAIIYFDVDDDRRVVTIVAVFFGGQDHHSHMLKRLRGT